MNLVAVIIPIIIIVILGNLDEDMRKFLKRRAARGNDSLFALDAVLISPRLITAVRWRHFTGAHDGGDWRIFNIFADRVTGRAAAWQARRYPPPSGNAVATPAAVARRSIRILPTRRRRRRRVAAFDDYYRSVRPLPDRMDKNATTIVKLGPAAAGS